MPFATFSGILHLDGAAYRLNGMAYLDHQWGTILIQEFVSDWVWGHLSNRDVSIVYFEILTVDGKQIDRVAMVTKDGQFSGTGLELSFLDALFSSPDPRRVYDYTSLSFLDRMYQVSHVISPEGIIRSRFEENQDESILTYLRWSTHGLLESNCKSQDLCGISEYIRIRPATYGSLSKSKHN